MHKYQWTTFPTHSSIQMHSFCFRLLHFIIRCLIFVTKLSRLDMFCVLTLFSLTYLFLKTSFCSSFYRYKVHTISFQTFFVWTFKIVADSWKFAMLLLYILWDDWLIFMISGSNEQLQQELGYTLLKPDCHSWWISKMQSGREDTRRMICYKIVF